MNGDEHDEMAAAHSVIGAIPQGEVAVANVLRQFGHDDFSAGWWHVSSAAARGMTSEQSMTD